MKHGARAMQRSAVRNGTKNPSPDNYAICCPFCPERVKVEDTLFKLTIRTAGVARVKRRGEEEREIDLTPQAAVWHCYRCHARGVDDFTWLVGGLEAPPRPESSPPVDLGPPEGFEALARIQAHVEPLWYMHRRGLGAQATDPNIGIGVCTTGRYRGRIVVPMLDGSRSRWTGFSARDYTGRARARYLYPAGMDRRTAVWGLEHERLRDPKLPVYVVEGVFDALPLFPYGLATLGKAITEEQIETLSGIGRTRPVVMCLDGDAWKECKAFAARLRLRGANVSWAHLPPGEDPGSLGWRVREFIQAGQ